MKPTVFAALHCIAYWAINKNLKLKKEHNLHCVALVLANTHIDIDIVKETEATFPRHQDLHGVTQPKC